MRKGQRVKYIPRHAGGNPSHKDCEAGVISSECEDEEYVFVKYDCAACAMVTGDEPYTAAKTKVSQLVRL